MHSQPSTTRDDGPELARLLDVHDGLRYVVESGNVLGELRRRGWRFDRTERVWRRGGQHVHRVETALVLEAERDLRRWLRAIGWRYAPGGRPVHRACREEIVAAAVLERALLGGRLRGLAA